ncbi:hypothetical protein F3Y22_tig00111398pilonHSYRG00030 [Hibiscus syriacus]|uniref:Uncharacterized protein n=1 Tax=Hibiscus syriacus TaxID=106335 RepID=A0A6A2XUZ8_HIBSY|nr:hypothetical protein F3Y22_tig00111398pilonHSYRG00030 [Hibiscus syriacus]
MAITTLQNTFSLLTLAATFSVFSTVATDSTLSSLTPHWQHSMVGLLPEQHGMEAPQAMEVKVELVAMEVV